MLNETVSDIIPDLVTIRNNATNMDFKTLSQDLDSVISRLQTALSDDETPGFSQAFPGIGSPKDNVINTDLDATGDAYPILTDGVSLFYFDEVNKVDVEITTIDTIKSKLHGS
jgi:hypothetical protein